MNMLDALKNHMLVFPDGKILVTKSITMKRIGWDANRHEIVFLNLQDKTEIEISIMDINDLQWELGKWNAWLPISRLENRAWRIIYCV